MKIFTAKQVHDDPTPIYQAALNSPVKITHKYHGDFILRSAKDNSVPPIKCLCTIDTGCTCNLSESEGE